MSETGKTMLACSSRVTLLLCIVAAGAGWLLFPDQGPGIALGVFAGGLSSLMGLVLIIRFIGSLCRNTGGQVKGRAFASYLVRYLLYGAVMILTVLAGGNLLGFLAGFAAGKLSLLFYSYSLRKER